MPLGLAAALAGAGSLAADFEAQPAPYQTVARPADGEVVSANPPCFVYPASSVHERYTVQVTRDPSFPPDGTRELGSSYMLLVPNGAFEPGTYHWRWRPAETAVDAWSSVRSFSVPDGAPVVPFPDLTRLVERLRGVRPRVFVGATGVEGLRAQAEATFGPDWQEAAARRAARAAGKALLPEPDFLPDRKDPRRTEVYQQTFRTTRPFFREMARLAEDFLLTGHEASGLEAKRRLLHIVSWAPRGSTGINHNDEPGTEVVRYCPTVYDRVYSLLTTAERQQCLACLTVRMQDMRERWRRRPFEKHPYESHNMGYYLPDVLEASLALVGDAPVEETLRYAMLQLWSPFYPPYGGADGGWCEGPNYWSWSTMVFARLYRLVEVTTGVPVHLRSNVRNMWRYKLYGNPPYFEMSPFGDGQEGRAGGGGTMAALARLYDNGYARWYADEKGGGLSGLDRLLLDPSEVEPASPDTLPQGCALRDVGLAAMHSVLSDPASNVAVLLRSCPFGSISHAFADQNTFALDAYGKPLIIASGYYQLYGHPHHAEWTRQTAASNSVLVNGEGQPARDWTARGRLSFFATTAGADLAVGDACEAYKGRLRRFDRTILFLRSPQTGGEPVVVIRDEIEAAEPSTFQFLLHAVQRMDVDASQQRVVVSNGHSRCRVDYLAPQLLKYDQHDRFPHPPIRGGADQWHLTAATAEPVRSIESLMVLQPFRADEPQELLDVRRQTGENCTAVVLSGRSRETLVLFRGPAPDRAASFGGLRTDARAASVLRLADRPVAAVLFAGTEVVDNGRELLKAGRSGTFGLAQWGRRGLWLLSSDGEGRTRLRHALGTGGEVSVSPDAPLRVLGIREEGATPLLTVGDSPPVPMEVQQLPYVQRMVAGNRIPEGGGHYLVTARVANPGPGRLPVVLQAGAEALRRVLAPGVGATSVVLPLAQLQPSAGLHVSGDESRGGRLVVADVACVRVSGVDLLPHGSFEEPGAAGTPLGWRPGSITREAKVSIKRAPGGHTGAYCLEAICEDATGGDFGAMLTWPGVRPQDFERRFRMGCWVRTDAESRAGLQVTSRNWRWWKNTERLAGKSEWTEAALEFVLPPGENITHVRLHMTSATTGAKLYVDDVSLVELGPEK